MNALNSEVGKKLTDEAIKYAPELYRLGTSKIKDRRVREAMESDVTIYIVKETQKKISADTEHLFG